MKLFSVLLLSFSATFSYAAEKCEGYAKYFAIRDYKANTGVVQGSEGIDYQSELISSLNDEHTFKVAITDNNEDGQYWTMNYEVVVKEIPNSQKCSLEKMKSEVEEP